MLKVIRPGRFFFAASMAVFGLQQFIISDFVPGLVPLPAWIPGQLLWVYLSGITLIAAGVSMMINKKARSAAVTLAIMWFLCGLLHLPRLITNPRAGGAWTTAFEDLAMCGGALVLAGTLSVKRPGLQLSGGGALKTISLGRLMFAASMPVFGVLHFVYAGYVAGVVPSWIPGPLFWAYFTGVAHITAGVSILTGVKARLAAILSAWMFGLWVILLHLPRVAAGPNGRNELTSTFIALAMCGGALLVAGSLTKEDSPQRVYTSDHLGNRRAEAPSADQRRGAAKVS